MLGLVLFVYSMTSAPSVVASEARDVPTDGSTTSVELKTEEVYGFYSQDTALRCTATGPDGGAVAVVARLKSGLGTDAAPAAVRPYGTPWSGQYPAPGQAQHTGQAQHMQHPGQAQRPDTAPTGGYGLAPRQVVYRPSPPSGSDDGTPPRS